MNSITSFGRVLMATLACSTLVLSPISVSADSPVAAEDSRLDKSWTNQGVAKSNDSQVLGNQVLASRGFTGAEGMGLQEAVIATSCSTSR